MTDDPLETLVDSIQLPTKECAVITTFMTYGTLRVHNNRYIRCNDIRWRHLEEPGEILDNREMRELLALSEAWEILN